MRYKLFGERTGLRASEIILGTGNFGTGWGHGAEPAEARRVFDTYAAAGGNFIDTADTYQGGQSEELLGEFLCARRDEFVVATNAPREARLEAWARLASDLDLGKLARATQVVALEEVPAVVNRMFEGKVQGRIVVDVNA